ncbi:MAG: CmpA/NrtA family ABC transporter substrate-binding protein [Pseudomonadota bacterium]
MKLRLGYIRLCDAAPLVVACTLGLFADEKLRVELIALSSWAEVRDRLITGDVQASHCLAGIPLAAQAGLFGPNADLATAFTLNHFGNALTLSPALAAAGGELQEIARQRRAQGRPLTLAAVFPVAKHQYELRHWLVTQGLDPETDVRMVVTPPPLVAAALRRGNLDGFCVGEPWSTRAILEGSGVAVATSRSLGLPGTEKVLAVRSDWLEDPAHAALLRALHRATQWLAEPLNRVAATELLAPYLGRPPEELLPALTGRFSTHANAEAQPIDDFVRFHGINSPEPAHALWYLEQMQAAGQLPHQLPLEDIVQRAFRPDIHQRVLGTR